MRVGRTLYLNRSPGIGQPSGMGRQTGSSSSTLKSMDTSACPM